ncbi:MAG: hypothetical protein AAF826_11365 [Pseudomonadota bacterium]
MVSVALVYCCVDEGLFGGESFGVDSILISVQANQMHGIDRKEGLPLNLTTCVVEEYLEKLDDAAFGSSTKVVPKYILSVDLAVRWMGANGGAAVFAFSTNYMLDL